MNPAQLGECVWEEWDCLDGNLFRKNCSFKNSFLQWKTVAKYYRKPAFEFDFN